MNVLVAGAHGSVGSLLTELLAENHYDVSGMVREESQVSEIEAYGANAVVADLTVPEAVSSAVAGHDAVVFAAGSGGEDVYGVDRDGATAMIDAAEEHDADRFVMLSAMNAESPEDSPAELAEYLEAKAQADEYLTESSLTSTIVRPGTLTDDPGTGEVALARKLTEHGEIARADVARVLSATIDVEATYGQTFELLEGDVPIETALETLASA